MAKQSLTEYLTSIINEREDNVRELANMLEDSRNKLENMDLDNANYAVHFNSLWTDHGGKNTTTNYKGSLREAIKKAENDFRRENGSDDTKQTRVYVDIKLEDLEYEVPKKYWSKYRSRK